MLVIVFTMSEWTVIVTILLGFFSLLDFDQRENRSTMDLVFFVMAGKYCQRKHTIEHATRFIQKYYRNILILPLTPH